MRRNRTVSRSRADYPSYDRGEIMPVKSLSDDEIRGKLAEKQAVEPVEIQPRRCEERGHYVGGGGVIEAPVERNMTIIQINNTGDRGYYYRHHYDEMVAAIVWLFFVMFCIAAILFALASALAGERRTPSTQVTSTN